LHQRGEVGHAGSVAEPARLVATRRCRIALFARNLQTYRFEHYEIFESMGMSADALARRISMRTDELHARFAVDRYDVFWEGYSSLRAMHRAHPEFGSLDSLWALLRST
jgi:hypothetical protein